jgi:D-arabinose 1-dehydrogenase-like Zn-dependent alcohol dehydrogenase
MRGVTFAGDRTIDFVEIPDPTPGPGEVVLEMKASGICGSDLHTYRAPRGSTDRTGSGLIGGHEPCGVVAACGLGVLPVDAEVGRRVMVHHYWGCGACKHCRSGWSQMCETQTAIVYGASGHGGHAPYMKVPARTLVDLPEELSFEAGAAIACGSGTAYAALRRLSVAGGDFLAVFGQGPVGLAATQFAAAMGARVIAVDVSPERLALAAEFGAAHLVNAGTGDPVEAIKDVTYGEGARISLEASGAPSAQTAAVGCLRSWGTCALVGIGASPVLDLDLLRRRQITVFGSWTFSVTGQADCAEFAARHQVAVDRIFTHRWRLEEAEEAYKVADAQNGGKGVFVMP